jgi:type I restriction enzyme R subunit
LIDIGERAERIRAMFESRQDMTKQALAELERIIAEINAARRARKNTKMDIRSFTIFWILKETGLVDHEEVSQCLADEFVKHPDWLCNAEEKRLLKPALYKLLLKTTLKDKVIEVVERLFKVMDELKRREGV